jgi:hypothetical protein
VDDAVSAKALPSAATLAVPEATNLERSAAILIASGHRLVPITSNIGPWQLLAVYPHGLVLLAVVEEWPGGLGVLYGALPGWPAFTRRILHRYPAGADWPETMAL